MEEKKRTGIPVQEFTYGNVESTVWANRAHDGGLVLKISLRRVQTTREGATGYRSSFYPDDLEDVARAAIRARAWVKELAGVFNPFPTNGIDPRTEGKKPVK